MLSVARARQPKALKENTAVNFRNARRFALVAALAAALVAPSSVLAATQNGTTTESITVSSSISLTIPASITYPAVGAGDPAPFATVALTSISTDNVTGLNVKMTANANGAGLITLATRKTSTPAVTGGIVAGTAAAYGFFTSATTQWTAATSTAAVTNGSATFGAFVNPVTYAPGVYTGTLSFTAATNP